MPARPAPSRCAPRSVLKARLLRKTLYRFLLLGAQLLRQRHMGLDVHVPVPSVFLDAMSGNPKLLAVLGPRRNTQHDALVIQRLDLDPRAEQRLREVDRDDADEIQPLARKKRSGAM